MPSRKPSQAGKPTADVETGEIAEDVALQALDLAFPGLEASNDTTAVVQRMIDRTMRAESLDELFSVREGNSSDQFVGRTIEFQQVSFDMYRTDEGRLIPIASISGKDIKTGESLEFVSTAAAVTSFLYRAAQLDALPFAARMVEKATKRGQKAIVLERP